jgi:LacI family transcriptional regulator
MALGVIKELNADGLRVPERYSVVGIDNLSISRYCNPELTTVAQNIYTKGQKAVEMIVTNIADPRCGKQEIVLPVSLVERQSVKRII